MIATHDLTTNSPIHLNSERVELIENLALPDRDNARLRFNNSAATMTVPGYAVTLAALGDAFKPITLANGHAGAVNARHVISVRHQRPGVVTLAMASGNSLEVEGELKAVAEHLA